MESDSSGDSEDRNESRETVNLNRQWQDVYAEPRASTSGYGREAKRMRTVSEPEQEPPEGPVLDESVAMLSSDEEEEFPEKGSGYWRFFCNIEEFVQKKQCIIQIKNRDELCCGRALVVARTYLQKDDPNVRNFRSQRCYDNHKIDGGQARGGRSVCDNMRKKERADKDLNEVIGKEHERREVINTNDPNVIEDHHQNGRLQRIQLDNGEDVSAIVIETEHDFQKHFGSRTKKSRQKKGDEDKRGNGTGGEPVEEIDGTEIDGDANDDDDDDEYVDEPNVIYTFDFESEQTTGEHKIIAGVVKCELDNGVIVFRAFRDGVHIQHVNNGGEKRVCGRKVDGFCEETKTVYEYNGCFYHGCQTCFKPSTRNPVNDTLMIELYMDTLRKKRMIERTGLVYAEMWTHEFDKIKENDPDYTDYRQRCPIVAQTPAERDGIEFLNPRDAFFGGRTNATKLYAKVTPGRGETIEYVDFTSLYPYVNKYGRYPTGHADIIVQNFKDVSAYFGVVKCKVLAPRKLYHPVLPDRVGDKLMFHLCRACATVRQQTPCHHSDDERTFVGTWASIELNLAVEHGYKILQIYEVHHFQNSSTTLFREYIDCFLRLKQESSGWPQWVLNAPDRSAAEERYLREYESHEGIKLDRANIAVNPGSKWIDPGPFEHIVWCYSEYQDTLHRELSSKLGSNVQFVEGLPDNWNDVTKADCRNAIVIDDQMEQVVKGLSLTRDVKETTATL
ncbi:Hypp6075 [Branchiostoma lanceolatum]|uniref:DNA-directed DNA polymerase n=1 Tax=Branchiostoma lanceolatum TaxID=7740 RepID=A0A8J9YSQ8_BRALA|nr:Hypp6075 [Branchiostoma lanceolatum]